jgi:putative restriction endonuclease
MERLQVGHGGRVAEPDEAVRRRPVEVLQRLGQGAFRILVQQGFRERVLRAYQEQCAICRLRHDELLEAAHILPDGHPKGEPIVPNGLALCALHHAAFDGNILGIRPDFVVEVRLDILREKDGPMLQHGLQGFQGLSILKPRSRALWPRVDFLSERYEELRRAS